MNHIKLFEYFVNYIDYVRVSKDAFTTDLYPIVKILGKKEDRIGLYYRVEGIDSKTNKMRILSMLEDELGEKASPEEIEEYETKKSAIKYNL